MKEKCWLVLRTKSRCENKVLNALIELGYVASCPCYTTLKQWSDRKKKVTVPLIPGVVFVQVFDGDVNVLYKINHVVSILKEHGKLALVRDVELQNLLILCGQWDEDLISQQNFTDYQPGDLVEVISGGFSGVKGTMKSIHGKHKLYIVIESMKMVFSILTPKSHVKLIKNG